MDYPGELVDESLDHKKVGTLFDFQSVLCVGVGIATLEDEIQNNFEYAMRKYENKEDDNTPPGSESIQIEKLETLNLPSYRNINLFSTSKSNIILYF